ncbi:MAG: septum formation initiator family protein [Candidatus Ventricola sp.]
MGKNKVRIRPFRILSVLLGGAALVMLSRFPAKAVSLERQQQQLEDAAQAYYDAQSRNNQLTTELSEINTADFVERTARRDYGYCWYGEVIYEVGNLEDIEQKPEFEIYDGEE